MKKLLVLLSIVLSLNMFGQIIVNEPVTMKGLSFNSCYVHIIITGQMKYVLDSTGQIVKADSMYTLYGHQYASLAAYLQGKDAMQIDQLLDSHSYKNIDGYYPVYKAALLAKNPTWKSENIIILQ